MDQKTVNDEQEWVWALVGNVVEEHPWGENREIRKGTKQFSPGAKVYLGRGGWGDGYENIYVIGKPRRTFAYIQIIMKSKLIENFRMQKVYKPAVLKKMKSEKGDWYFWDNSEASRVEIIRYLNFLNPEEASKQREKVIADGKLYSDIKNLCISLARSYTHSSIAPMFTDEEFSSFIDYINQEFKIDFKIKKYSEEACEELYHALLSKELDLSSYSDFYYKANRLRPSMQWGLL